MKWSSRCRRKVALLAEGVDRNPLCGHPRGRRKRSPSSRRAWIEIDNVHVLFPPVEVALLAEGVDRNLTFGHGITPFRMVALLAEGVDRNLLLGIISGRLEMSPSSRRAWIEIAALSPSGRPQRVALLAEGVDRNLVLVGFGPRSI